MIEETPVAFAFYKGKELIGYRQDTIGTIGMRPKIYGYSKEQVETCLKNIRQNVKNPVVFGKIVGIIGESPELSHIISAEKEVYDKLHDVRAFEVRVVKAPEYEKVFDVNSASYITDWLGGYPHVAVQEWLKTPELHDVIETHYFTMVDGKILLS